MLKRLICFILAAVMLTGCAAEQEPAPTQATEQVQFYEPNSTVEEQTQGAIRAYPLDTAEYTWLRPIGNHLLLGTVGQQCTLTVISGIEGIMGNSLTVPSDGLSLGVTGMRHYDAQKKSIVCYSAMLKKLNEIALPENITGVPQVNPATGEIYYCSQSNIYGFDSETGITRLIKTHTYQSLELKSAAFDGAVLVCTAADTEGKQHTLYLSTEDGRTLGDDDGMIRLDTWQDRFFAERKEGVITRYIFGKLSDKVSTLNIEGTQILSALALDGVVTRTDTQDGSVLSFYDLAAGKKKAELTLTEKFSVVSCVAESESNCVWLLCAADGKQFLYRWDIVKSLIEDDAVYTGAFYTQDAPDTEGIKACQARVDALNKKHGIEIRIWNDALKTQGVYVLEAEHQPEAINLSLDALEKALEIYPENFLYKSVAKRIRICIVRSIDGKVDGVQFWDGQDPYIVLAVGADVSDRFTRGMGYVVDSHILGNSSMVDQWQKLNPSGFTYGPEQNDSYLTGVDKAFLDMESKQSATEDRSRIFYQAMQPNSAQMFESARMQKKLVQLCKAIRNAWRLERKTEIYAWEQYLKEPINFNK